MNNITGHEYAYPTPIAGGDIQIRSALEIPHTQHGLTIRQLFAKDAPNKIPDWFVHNQLPKDFKRPSKETLSPEDRKIVDDWHYDPCWDLPENLKWYQDATSKFFEDELVWKQKDETSRYFQWRTFFADALSQELNR